MSVRKTKSRISRRSALKLGGAALIAAPFVKRAQADGGKVVIGSWGGPYTDAQVEAYFVPFEAATGIKVEIDKQNKITVSGADKQQVGQVAAEIRGLRSPDAYKGKGIRYAGEQIRLKVGKAAGGR